MVRRSWNYVISEHNIQYSGLCIRSGILTNHATGRRKTVASNILIRLPTVNLIDKKYIKY